VQGLSRRLVIVRRKPEGFGRDLAGAERPDELFFVRLGELRKESPCPAKRLGRRVPEVVIKAPRSPGAAEEIPARAICHFGKAPEPEAVVQEVGRRREAQERLLQRFHAYHHRDERTKKELSKKELAWGPERSQEGCQRTLSG